MTYTNSNCIAPLPFFIDKLFKDLIDINLEDFDAKIKTNIYTSDNGNIFEFAIPGVEKKDIEITFNDNVLAIKTNNANGSKKERSFKICYKVDTDKITSSLENGILRVTMPKLAEENKSIKITIA